MAQGGSDVSQDSANGIYSSLFQYKATSSELDLNGYPRPGDTNESAVFRSPKSKPVNNSEKKSCVRCSSQFLVKTSGEITKEICRYHYGRCYDGVWQCCMSRERVGCKTSETHVHNDNLRDLSGYVKTTPKAGTSPGIYAIDCEMSYTTDGMEVTRVSIVDHNYKTVYDSYVKPYGEILSYNTEHSGITAENLRGVTTTLADVQKFMLGKFSSETLVVGHSLEYDFVALRLIHETVVDTSLMYAHPKKYLGWKFSLRTLAKKHLQRRIQDGRHDSVEDAETCMRLAMRRVNPGPRFGMLRW